MYGGGQTSFCLQQVIGVDQEKWTGIKKLVSLQMGIMSEPPRKIKKN